MEDREMALGEEVEGLLFKDAKGLVLTAMYTLEDVFVLDAFGLEGDGTLTFISEDGQEIWGFLGRQKNEGTGRCD